jgi:hypothetical protein
LASIVFLTVTLYGANNPFTGGVTMRGTATAHVVPQAKA